MKTPDELKHLIGKGFDAIAKHVETGFESMPLWWAAFKREMRHEDFVFPVKRSGHDVWLHMQEGKVFIALFRRDIENSLLAT